MQRLIPPLLVLICYLFIYIIHTYLPSHILIKEPYHWFGVLFFIIGLLISRSISHYYKKVGTEINTFKRPGIIITDGLFKYSRNPIYFGMTLALFGLWFLHGSIYSFIPVLVFWSICNFWYIPIEEKNMEAIFNEEYLVYKSEVRRWL